MTEGGLQVGVFVSSPADAQFERGRLERVIERLNGEFQGVARLTAVRWETEFYKAHDTFQAQIPEAAQCDIVFAIFRSRLGSELPANFPRMANGEAYPSGTAYEVLSAIEAAKDRGLPDVYVFRYPQPPSVQLDDPNRADIEAQWDRLKNFFETWFRTSEGQFKAAFQTFNSTDDFEARAEALLRKWLEEKVLHGRSVVWPVDIKGSPFRGLATFGAKHAPVFFGRSRDIAKAVERLKDAAEKGCRFLLVDGASGAGKSSLVRAGLVPRLTAAGVVPSIDLWRVAVMRPGELGDDPIAALAAALFVRGEDLPEPERGRPAALPELSGSDFSRAQDLAAQLAHADDTALKPLIGTLAAIARMARQTGGYDRAVNIALLLVVDQLDELFGAGIAEETRTRFAKLIDLLARSGRVWIIATLRGSLIEEFLAQPQFKSLKEDGASYDLAPPDSAELAEIVRAPAAAAGLVYEADATSGVTLDEGLLNDAGRPDLLPLLQFALSQLFEAARASEHANLLTLAAYRALGGLEGAVDKEAEAALKTVGEAERARLPRLLRELVAPARDSGIGAARAAFDIRSVALAEAAHDETSAKLVRALVDARILLAAGDGKATTVRLAHARVLDSWQRAKTIVAENADFYRIRADVEEQRRRWEAAGRTRDLLIGRGRPLAEAETIVRRFPAEVPGATRDFIKRSGRRARLAQTLTAAAAVLFAVVAGAAVYAQRQAARERQRAEETLAAATETANALVVHLAQRFRNVAGVPADVIAEILDQARALQEQLTETGQVTPELRFSEANGLITTAQSLLTIGETAAALPAAEQARQILKDLLADNSGNADWQYLLSAARDTIGDVQVAQGDLQAALASYRDSLAIKERLAKAAPDNTGLQSGLADSYTRVGNVLLAQGDLQAALASYRESLTVTVSLLKVDPKNEGWQRDFSASLVSIGDVLLAQGNVQDADRAYSRALVEMQWPRPDPNNADSQYSLAVAWGRVGKAQAAQGNLDRALESYRKNFAITERLAKADPNSGQWQHELSVSYWNIGDVQLAQGDLQDALASYRDSLAIMERLTKADPNNAGWQRDLSVAYNKVGDVQKAQGDLGGALKSYRDGLAIIERLAKAAPDNAGWERDLSLFYDRIGDVQAAPGDLDGALKSYRDSLAIGERLVSLDRNNAQWQNDLQYVISNIGTVSYKLVLAREFATALEAADQVISLAPDKIWLYENRAHALMFLGRVDEARALYLKYRGQKMAEQDGKSWETVVLEDFAELRKADLTSPLMDEIEKLFTSAG